MTRRRSGPPASKSRTRRGPGERDYVRLARFRHALRRFLRFSEAQARGARISPNQYQLMLFIRGFDGPPPSIAQLADRLQIQHQSAVGLVDRSARAGLVRRSADSDDRRRVRVVLTNRGERILARLVAAHARQFDRLWKTLAVGRTLAKAR